MRNWLFGFFRDWLTKVDSGVKSKLVIIISIKTLSETSHLAGSEPLYFYSGIKKSNWGALCANITLAAWNGSALLTSIKTIHRIIQLKKYSLKILAPRTFHWLSNNRRKLIWAVPIIIVLAFWGAGNTLITHRACESPVSYKRILYEMNLVKQALTSIKFYKHGTNLFN